MSDLFGNHIVGFSTRWLIYVQEQNIKETNEEHRGQCFKLYQEVGVGSNLTGTGFVSLSKTH